MAAHRFGYGFTVDWLICQAQRETEIIHLLPSASPQHPGLGWGPRWMSGKDSLIDGRSSTTWANTQVSQGGLWIQEWSWDLNPGTSQVNTELTVQSLPFSPRFLYSWLTHRARCLDGKRCSFLLERGEARKSSSFISGFFFLRHSKLKKQYEYLKITSPNATLSSTCWNVLHSAKKAYYSVLETTAITKKS